MTYLKLLVLYNTFPYQLYFECLLENMQIRVLFDLECEFFIFYQELIEF